MRSAKKINFEATEVKEARIIDFMARKQERDNFRNFDNILDEYKISINQALSEYKQDINSAIEDFFCELKKVSK